MRRSRCSLSVFSTMLKVQDVSYLSSTKLPGGPTDRGITPVAPDLAVEVISPTDPAIDDRQILDAPPPDEARSISIVRGRNIVPPPEGKPLPETLEGRVVIVVEDDVSTGDMAPDGALVGAATEILKADGMAADLWDEDAP